MTKEAQRAELHKTIWRIANDLRGSVDGWDFKTYVLGMLFYRFISENLTAYLNDHERKSGSPDFDYSTLADGAAVSGPCCCDSVGCATNAIARPMSTVRMGAPQESDFGGVPSRQ